MIGRGSFNYSLKVLIPVKKVLLTRYTVIIIKTNY